MQASDNGDARRDLIVEADRVLSGEVDRMVIRLRRTEAGRVYVETYTPECEET